MDYTRYDNPEDEELWIRILLIRQKEIVSDLDRVIDKAQAKYDAIEEELRFRGVEKSDGDKIFKDSMIKIGGVTNGIITTC